MAARIPTYFLFSILVLSASASRAGDNQRPLPAADQVQALQSEISDPARFKNYVEGSRQLPEGAPSPSTQVLPGLLGQAAASKAQLNHALTDLRPKREAFPPAPARAARPASPIDGSRPELPVAGLALAALLAAGWLARRGLREPVAEIQSLAAPAPASLPNTPLFITPSATTRMDLPATAQEPYIDTRMPISTWRAISWREQGLIERWDASPEKALGQASFEEWLDTQGKIAGVDMAMLKAKLRRDI